MLHRPVEVTSLKQPFGWHSIEGLLLTQSGPWLHLSFRSSPDSAIAVFAAHKQSIKIQGIQQSHHENLKQVAGKTQNPVTDENYHNLRFTF